MTVSKSSLAVIEGKWSSRKNLSVKLLFDLLSDLNFDNPHEYYYEMFCDDRSLENVVSRMGQTRGVRYLYLGAHGTNGYIDAAGGKVGRSRLRNILRGLGGRGIDGAFIGSCLFGREQNAEFLLVPGNGDTLPIKWLAGYTTEIDWIDSSVLDMLFWNKYFCYEGTPNERIERVASDLRRLVPGLIHELGFCIYRRKLGGSRGVVNILSSVT